MRFLHTKSRVVLGVGILLLAGTVWTVVDYFIANSATEKTQDAYVTADFTLVAPKIAGLVDRVLVEDNQAVRKGDILVTIDDRDYRTALASANAEVSSAQASTLELDAQIARQPSLIDQAAATLRSDQAAQSFARANAVRYKDLSSDGSGTIQESEQASSVLRQSLAACERDFATLQSASLQLGVLKAQRGAAGAALEKAMAARGQAQLNLSYTIVRAPIAGFVGRRSVRPGSYLDIGSAMLAIVPTKRAYILANFQESQLRNVRLHQPVSFTVDTFPGLSLRGHVDSLAPATDVAFAPIQPDNATGNFTKIVQRVPVKIVIDPGQDKAALLRVGMSVTPTIDVTADGDVPLGIGQALK
jgi:membrane fusion protein (multidrug efflux system)